MSDDLDLGLKMLLSVRTELGIDLDDDIIEKCFEIQKRYQFSHDRSLSVQAMGRLINEYIEKTSSLLTQDRC